MLPVKIKVHECTRTQLLRATICLGHSKILAFACCRLLSDLPCELIHTHSVNKTDNDTGQIVSTASRAKQNWQQQLRKLDIETPKSTTSPISAPFKKEKIVHLAARPMFQKTERIPQANHHMRNSHPNSVQTASEDSRGSSRSSTP